MKPLLSTFLLTLFCISFIPRTAVCQIGTVLSYQKISDISGNFNGNLDPEDNFCRIANIGDLNGDGFTDIAVGAYSDDDGGYNTGAVWILFLNASGTVINHQKISATEGNFSGQLDSEDRFGYDVCSLGDFDGDEINDIAVGAIYDDDGDINTGALWILFLQSDGTVKSYQKISKYYGNFNGNIQPHNFFGISISNIGDFDNDGIIDLAVGATGDTDGGFEKTGALWFLYMNNDGTVKTYSKISATQGNFTGTLDPADRFGRSCSILGDLDCDGTNDIAVGAVTDDDGGYNKGALWILFLNPNGSVKAYNKISNTNGNFNAYIDDNDQLGLSTNPLGDIDNDGIVDLAVSCHLDDDGGSERGAVYILFLNIDGSVKSHQKISNTYGGFTGSLSNGDSFGVSASFLGDINSDGNIELAAGSPFDDDGGIDLGAVWILTIDTYSNSIKENFISNSIYACPNPFKEQTLFTYNSDFSGEKLRYEIEIFDINGKKVFFTSNTFISTFGSNLLFEWKGISSRGKKLEKGIYFSMIKVNNVDQLYHTANQKLIIQ